MEVVTLQDCQIVNADCLEYLRGMEDNSVDLIATDPPYFRVKAEEWDRQWKDETAFLAWIGELCEQWRRVLKPNGSLYVFASAQMATKVEVKISDYFNVLNSIRWHKPEGWHNKAKKEELRSYLTPCEKVIFAEQTDNPMWVFQTLLDYLEGERKQAGVSFEEVRQMVGCATGSGLPSHWFTRSQWLLPTVEQYSKLQKGFGERGDFLRRGYEELRREYEELRRPFNLDKKRATTDHWDFPTVQGYEGKHPCEKPVSMMRHIIEVSSRPNALVLDCFNGSGATGEAAHETGRRFIGIEKDPHWFRYGCRRIEMAQSQLKLAL